MYIDEETYDLVSSREDLLKTAVDILDAVEEIDDVLGIEKRSLYDEDLYYDEVDELLSSREELLKTAEAIADEIDDIDYELEKVATNFQLVGGVAREAVRNRINPARALPAGERAVEEVISHAKTEDPSVLREIISKLTGQRDKAVREAKGAKKDIALLNEYRKNMRRNAYIAGGIGAAGVGGGVYYGHRQRKKGRRRERAIMNRGLVSRILNRPA